MPAAIADVKTRRSTTATIGRLTSSARTRSSSACFAVSIVNGA
jgi:hypothetical protein